MRLRDAGPRWYRMGFEAVREAVARALWSTVFANEEARQALLAGARAALTSPLATP